MRRFRGSSRTRDRPVRLRLDHPVQVGAGRGGPHAAGLKRNENTTLKTLKTFKSGRNDDFDIEPRRHKSLSNNFNLILRVEEDQIDFGRKKYENPKFSRKSFVSSNKCWK